MGKEILVTKEDIIDDIQSLTATSVNDLLSLRENMINQMNGIMDCLSADLVELQIKVQKLEDGE